MPPEQLATRLGLDHEKFRACLTSPATAARLADDIAAGTRAKFRTIPAYVVDGVLHDGRHFPLERFPLPPHLKTP